MERLEERRFLSVAVGPTVIGPTAGGSAGGSAGASVASALDPGFGYGGMVTTSVLDAFNTHHFDGADGATDGVELPDGKLLVAGTADSNSALALLRYNPDGSLDGSFGVGGQSVHDYGTNQVGWVTSVRMQDGKILVGGYGKAESSPVKGFVRRFNADGTPDASFGDNGVALFDYETRSSVSRIAVAPDGGIIAAGTIGYADESDEDFAVARLTPDGQRDLDFGENGFAVLDLGGLDSLGDMAVQPDGKIVVGGASKVAPATGNAWRDSGMWLARYRADGSIDGSFGEGGIVHLTAGAPTRVARLAIDSAGSVVAAGPLVSSPSAVSNDVLIAKFTPSGRPDASFGENGRLVSPAATNVVGLNVDADSNILLSAFRVDVRNDREVGGRNVFALYASDGSASPALGAGGQYVVRYPTNDRLAFAAVVAPPRLYVLGSGATTNQQGLNSYGFKVAAFDLGKLNRQTSGKLVKPVVGKGVVKLSAGSGALNVKGSIYNDLIQLDRVGAKVRVMVNGKAASFALAKVRSIRIEGGDGDDAIVINAGVRGGAVYGGDGNDTILGGNGHDRLYGQDGDDTLDGRVGHDRVYGGRGHDSLFGGDPPAGANGGSDGNDSLLGGDGDDALRPGPGGDLGDGGADLDRVLTASRPGSSVQYFFSTTRGIEQFI